MTKVSQTPDQWAIRIFRTEPSSKLVELDDTGFANEDQLHRLIEGNIGTLFHDLTFLKREFRELDGGQHIPDTVAFDAEQNTFVVIEYKNKLDKGVIDQAKTYLKYMKKNKQALVLEYVNSEDDGMLDLKSYNWNVYAIIMAPEFSKNQIDSTEDDGDLELHEIRWYSESVMMVRRVGGAHEGAPTRPKHINEPSDLTYETVRSRLLSKFPGAEVNEKPKHYNGFRYPGRAYFCSTEVLKRQIWLRYSGKSVAITSMADFEQALADMKTLVSTLDAVSEEPDGMDRLYADARAKLLSAFPGMMEKQMKLYDRFSMDGRLFCTMGKQKSKIWLHYSGFVSNPAPDRPAFVSPVEMHGWGTGRWRSAIRSMSDFDLALTILKKLHVAGRPEPGPEKKAERKLGKKADRETWSGSLRFIPLPEIDFQKEREPPIQVSWGGRTHGGLESWVGVLLHVTEWLVIYEGRLTKSSCPVMSGPKLAILNTSPFNPDGTEFRESEKVGVLFLNKHGSKETVIRNACKLAQAAGLDARFFEAKFPKRDD